MTRPTLEETFFAIALEWAKRSTCSERISVGAVLVNPWNQIIASGYNGSPRGLPHCDDVGCDDDGKNHRVVHAEVNVVAMCSLNGLASRDSKMYVTHCPCQRCSQVIIQAGILEVIYLRAEGPVHLTEALLHSAGIQIRQFKTLPR